MSKGQWLFKPSDVKRTIETVQAKGLEVRGVEIGKDKFTVLTGKPAESGDGESDNGKNPWDEVYASNEKRAS